MSFHLLLEITALLYLVELAFYSYAGFVARRTPKQSGLSTPLPKVSVVVAAKDEEKNLPSCIGSLIKIDYPNELIEIIIVNDQSTDATATVIENATKKFKNIIRVDAKESPTLRGKVNALSQGIDAAKGEYVFLTDADCIVHPTWVRETLKYFGDKTGLVGGVTLIANANKTVHGIQAVDWDFLLSIGAGAATLEKPVACLGNNLVFRKKAYEEVGGYRKIKFSVTEDFALFKAIASSGRWAYSFPMDRLTLVETLPVNSVMEVFSQRKRWATGGKETGLFGFLTLAPGFFFHWLIILSLLFSIQDFVPFFLLKILSDAIFVFPTLRLYGKIAHLKFMVYFEIYYLMYVAILPFSVYFGKAIMWKGRKY